VNTINDAALAGFLFGFLFGVCIGLTWALHLMERRAKRYKEAKVELVVTSELAQKIVDNCMTEALQNSGLVVMPKGKEFHWPGEKTR
jgi:hypothetical protein